MHTNSEYIQKVQKEASDIGKYAGLTCSRIFLLICLLVLMLPMRPTSVYLLFFTALFPWIFGNILENRQAHPHQMILAFCAKKYYYTPARYLSEKCSGFAFMLFLITWQMTVKNSGNLADVWKVAPACTLLLYCLCRLISTLFFRRKIRREYFQMQLLD